MKRTKGGSPGFTLIETMVCLCIALLLIVAAYHFFDIHHKNYKGQSERVDLQDNARGAMDFIGRSIKQAVGFPAVTASSGTVSFSVPLAFGVSTGSNTDTTLNDTGQNWATNEWTGYRVVIASGPGQNEVRTVSSNSSNQLTVSSAWSVTPDSTSQYKIISDRQFTLAGNSLQYQDTTTSQTEVLVENVSSFEPSRSGGRVDIAMTLQTDRALPDSGAVGNSRLVSSVEVRN